MRGRSIKGSTRPWEQAGEVARRRQHRRLFGQLQRQASALQRGVYRLRALLDLRLGKRGGVAGGGGVDDDLEPLGSARARARARFGVAILRADIDGRVGGDAAGGEVGEFGGRVAREEDVVAKERKTERGAVRAPHQRRKRAAPRRLRRNRGTRRRAERAVRERGGIGVADDRGGVDALARGEPHPRRAAALDHDVAHRRAIAEDRAVADRQRLERLGQGMHPAGDQPHPGRLDMRDEHQRRRAQEGRGATIGRIAPEQLPQPRIVEMRAERGPQAFIGADLVEVGQPAPSHPPRQPERIGLRRAQEGRIERLEDPLRLGAEGTIAGGGARAGKGADRRLARGGIGEQIEPIVAPGMPREHARRGQRQMRLERAAAVGEDFVEHVAQREHRRAGVDRHAACDDFAHLPAGTGRRLDDRDGQAARGEQSGAGQPANSGTDDEHRVLRTHVAILTQPMSTRLDSEHRPL